jgi:hypothetical protein
VHYHYYSFISRISKLICNVLSYFLILEISS